MSDKKWFVQRVITLLLLALGIAMAAILIGGALVGYDTDKVEDVGWLMFLLFALLAGAYMVFGAPDELFHEGKLEKELREAQERTADWQYRAQSSEQRLSFYLDTTNELDKQLRRKNDELERAQMRNEFLELKVKELTRWQVEHLALVDGDTEAPCDGGPG